MKTKQPYIVLLRGINISGKNLIKMVDLKTMTESLGFERVVTYIQSGNMVVYADANTACHAIADSIAKGIAQKFGLEVAVLAITPAELRNIIANNPYADKDEKALYVTFLHSQPQPDRKAMLEATVIENEFFTLAQKTVYLYLPKGYGTTKIHNNFLEQKLKVKATTRNWKTTTILADMAS